MEEQSAGCFRRCGCGGRGQMCTLHKYDGQTDGQTDKGACSALG